MEGTAFAERLAPIFARINLLMTYLQGFEVKRKVYVSPLGSLNDKFYRGRILFQCVFDNKRRDVFAAGGRYDSLVQEFTPKLLGSPAQTHAVGFNLSWDRLSSAMVEFLKAPTKTPTKHSETDAGDFWRTRRVSPPTIQPSCFSIARSLTYTSVMCLWPALTSPCCAH